MPPFKIIALLLVFCSSYIQAQNKANSSDQIRTVEINNDNGELSITFVNSNITEFIVNDTAIAQDRYDDFQAIIDDFTDEGVKTSTPTPPTPPGKNENESNILKSKLVKYLMNEGIINSATKYKVQLKSNFLKVNGEKASSKIHSACLGIFNEIYGHRLNIKSEVRFRKSRSNSTSSIKILDLN